MDIHSNMLVILLIQNLDICYHHLIEILLILLLNWDPHVAPLGITFYDKENFPAKYKNSVFVALHGSWNRTKKSGYTVVFVKLDDDGNYLYQEDFISGWLSNESAWGRPVSPYIMRDGSMLLSDDKYNVIYRVSYKG